jgi:hypothetical protein
VTCALALAVLLVACRQSASEKLAAAIEPAGSWLASLQLVAERWNENAVPTTFARNTLDAGREQLASAAAAAADSGAPAPVVQPVRRLLARADGLCAGFAAALERGDRAEAAAAALQFHQLRGELERWKTSPQGGGR